MRKQSKKLRRVKYQIIYFSHFFNPRRETKSFITSTAAKLLNIWR